MSEPFDLNEGTDPGVKREEFKVSGSQLVDKVQELLHEGNIRRIVIKHEGQTVMELPLTLAAVGVLFAPVLAALGAFAALATNSSILVERLEDKTGGNPAP
jgi:hypothetical protein